MKKFLLPCVLAALAGCGGAASTDEFTAAAPSFEQYAIAQNDADTAETAQAPPAASSSTALTSADCHPHLFVRTSEVIERVNRHFLKVLRHVERVIRNQPTLADGQTHVWERVEDGIDRKLTMTRAANVDGSATFTWSLELKSAQTADFVQVASGTLTKTAAGATIAERKGSASLDYSALHQVIPAERATGQLALHFDLVKDPSKPAPGEKRSMDIALAAFLPEEGDPHGPRTGGYSWKREPGVGGKFSFADSVVLLCPSNAAAAAADLKAVSRWYKAADGAVHGRSDAQATGGQIAQGHKWEGVTCAQGPTTTTPAEGYWMMKEEDVGGATVTVSSASVGASPCDAVFGAVPDQTSSVNDYDFSQPLTFPNEW